VLVVDKWLSRHVDWSEDPVTFESLEKDPVGAPITPINLFQLLNLEEDLRSLFLKTGLVKSNSDIKRLIKQNGLRVNGVTILEENLTSTLLTLFSADHPTKMRPTVVLRRGKSDLWVFEIASTNKTPTFVICKGQELSKLKWLKFWQWRKRWECHWSKWPCYECAYGAK